MIQHILTLLRIGNDVQQKGWYASKTIWFNILTLGGVVAARYGFDLGDDDIVAIAAGLSTIGNVVLRFTTDTPIGKRTVPVPDSAEAPLPGDEKPFGLS